MELNFNRNNSFNSNKNYYDSYKAYNKRVLLGKKRLRFLNNVNDNTKVTKFPNHHMLKMKVSKITYELNFNTIETIGTNNANDTNIDENIDISTTNFNIRKNYSYIISILQVFNTFSSFKHILFSIPKKGNSENEIMTNINSNENDYDNDSDYDDILNIQRLFYELNLNLYNYFKTNDNNKDDKGDKNEIVLTLLTKLSESFDLKLKHDQYNNQTQQNIQSRYKIHLFLQKFLDIIMIRIKNYNNLEIKFDDLFQGQQINHIHNKSRENSTDNKQEHTYIEYFYDLNLNINVSY